MIDPDSLSPVIRREKRRAGLKIYTQITIDLAADDPNRKETIQEVMRLFRASTPQARLDGLKKRAERYSDDEAIEKEIQWIEANMGVRNKGQAVDFALRALARGLDLLDTGRHLEAILRDQKVQAGRRKGALATNVQRGKLPPLKELLVEIENLMKGRQLSPQDARSAVRNKYKVSRSALSQKLADKKR